MFRLPVKTAINMNFIQIDASIANSLSRLLIGYLQQSVKSHGLKVDILTVKVDVRIN